MKRESISIQLFQAAFPVPGFPAVVRDSKNTDVRGHFEVDNVIRKAGDRAASNWQVGRHSSDQGARAWHRHNPINGRVNGIEELDPKVLATSLVPPTSEAVFGVRLVIKANARIHRR